MKYILIIFFLIFTFFSCKRSDNDTIVKNCENYLINQIGNPQDYKSEHVELMDILFKSDLIYYSTLSEDDSTKRQELMDEIYHLNQNPKEDSVIMYVVEIEYGYVDSAKNKIKDNKLVSYNTISKEYRILPKE